MKKLIAIALALMLCVSALSVVAFAAPEGVNSLAIVGSSIPGVEEWKPGSASGDMTEVSNNVYEKVLEVTAACEMKIKFAANDDWVDSCNLGGATAGMSIVIGETMELTNGGGSNDLTLSVSEPCTLKVTVDLNAFAEGGAATLLVTNANGSGSGTPAPSTPAPAPAPEYDALYVAGTGKLCNGKEWDPAAAENKMTKGDDGIWSITYKNVAAGDYEIKVTVGNWDKSWGDKDGQNLKFSIKEAGDITVKFNPSTNKITVYHGNNPITGDMNLAGLSIALLAATAGVVALTGKKKEF